MPGAGSYAAANHIYNVAPKDGTVIGIIARDAPMGPLNGQQGPRFDPLKISWVGTPTKETNVCIAFHTAKVTKIEDLYTTELIMGDVGSGTGTHTYPKALSSILGLKFKLIAGFSSSAEVFLAMERGEVDGICESLDSVHGKKPDWIPKKTVNLIFQGGAAPNPEIKNVPFVLDLARTDEQRAAIRFLYAGQAIGRPFLAPPDLPPGPSENAARRLQRDDEGFRIHRRDEAPQPRTRPGNGRAARSDDQADLRDAKRCRRQGQRAHQVTHNWLQRPAADSRGRRRRRSRHFPRLTPACNLAGELKLAEDTCPPSRSPR